MYKIIERYCNSELKNGLLLLDMPTGSGKTYSVLNYIFDAVQDTNDKQKYFFITSLKKNLPIEEIEERFDNKGQLELYKEKVLFVDSNSESVISGFTPDIVKTIPIDIKKSEEYKKLKSYIESVQKLRQKGDGYFKSILTAAEDKLRTDIEPKFRKYIQGLLAKKFAKVEERTYAIKTDKEWQWVAQLYPSVFLKEKQVIFMSVDKFLTQISTIVEPSCMLYNSKLLDEAVIFIDEFDASKATILDSIIKNGLRDRVDYIELFKAIYAALHTHKFPSILTTSSKKRQEGQYKERSLQSILDDITEKSEEIYKLYSLQFSHKTETVTDENAKNFLFQDHQYHSILNGNKSYISAVSDSKKRINAIRFTDDKPNTDTSNIQIMLGKLRGFISYFSVGVNILAINYKQCKDERRKPNEDEFSHESAIRTVLAEFGLDNTYINYLTSQILIASRKTRGAVEGAEFDLSFYERGFRYYAFVDDYAHDMQSKIMMFSFQTTPEKLLLRFCEKAKVVGVSATATVPTAIGNYDLEYLQQKLQEKYFVITDSERERLAEGFSESVDGYDNVKINTQLVGTDGYSVDSWRQVIDSDEGAKLFYDIVERSLSDESKSYNKERYLRISIVFKEFLVKKDIKSFLCVLTKHPRYGDKVLDKKVLDELFDIIRQRYDDSFDIKSQVVQLDGEEYDNKKDEIIRRLGEGAKLFVLSVYQTIGAGQNLQYPIPKCLSGQLIKTNRRKENTHKDFDAIYLDKPTNLIVQLDQNLTEEDFVKYLFQVEMLQEVSEISAQNTMALVKRAFRSLIAKAPVADNDFASNVYQCKSVGLLSTRMIIQAIGRICRTNMKSRNIYIYADSRIADYIDRDITKGRNYNPEFIELLKNIGAGKSPAEVVALEDAAALKSVRVNRFIKSMMPNRGIDEDWTDEKIERWKQLRELVLTTPTMAAEEVDKNFIAYNFYIRLPQIGNKYYYSEEKDFNSIAITFKKTQNTERCVSEESAKLCDIMKLEWLKRHFEKHGWATEFAVNDFIMAPPLFNNIYRGALGEVVGKALFYKYADNVELEDITDNKLFEFFDYKFPAAPIYVDFKNWHDTSIFDDEEMTRHIIDKAKSCEAKCVIIANIIEKSCYKIRKKNIDGIELLILPSLLLQDEDNAFNAEALDEIRRCVCEYAD